MANLMSLAQYEARLGRSLTGTKATQVEAFIADASALVRKIANGELDDHTSDDVHAVILPVIFSMVNRGLHNPRGHDSEKIGDYSYQGGGAIYATEDEKTVIREAAEVSAIGHIDMTSPMPLHLKRNVWEFPTYPGV